MKSLTEYINESNNIELVSDGNEHGFEYVDIGLPSGTIWATCNVGADTPEDPGLLFQFGRVDGYRYGDRNNKFTTDDLTTASGKVYKKNEILNLSDDAAHVNMGGKWRMPTCDELKELIGYTTKKVTTINGTKGSLFTSDINGNNLFIPFDGYWYNNFYGNAYHARIWSSQVYTSYVNIAYRLFCDLSGNANIGDDSRSFAFSVRGVFK